jgi:hypothetical protein
MMAGLTRLAAIIVSQSREISREAGRSHLIIIQEIIDYSGGGIVVISM